MAQLDYLSNVVLRNASGAPYTSAKAYYYSDVGATTPLNVYSDAGLSSALSNPVVADGTTGAFPAIYLQAKRYWRVVKTSADVSLPEYNSGPIDGFVTLVESAAAPSPTYKLMYWYDTTTGKLKRRDSTNASWLDLGGIDSLLNASSVTEQLTGTATDKSSTPDSVAALWQRGTDIASGSSLSLPSTGGGVFNVTGVTTINGISSAQGGRTLWLKFASALTLTHNGTSFILPGAANITTVAGDMACFINEAAADASGSNWRCFNYMRASGSPINVTDQVATQAEMEAFSSTAKIVTPGRVQYHPGVAKCWGYFDFAGGTNASHNITSITDTATGRITVTIATDFSSANWVCVGELETTGGLCNTHQSKAAGSIELRSSNGNSAALQDATSYDFAGFGDQ